MDNKDNPQAGIFDLLNQWSSNLPKNSNEFAESSISTLNDLGKEFKQRCTVDQTSTSLTVNQALPIGNDTNTQMQTQQSRTHSQVSNKPVDTPLNNSVKKPVNKSQETIHNELSERESTALVVKKDHGYDKLKPPFFFELKSDDITGDNKERFVCVYDFCVCLEEYCLSMNLNIEKDWYKLLSNCTSHNYDRFMWVFSTFQNASKLGLRWKQVVKRLMSKYDDPERKFQLESILQNYRHLMSMDVGERIYKANYDFARFADELDLDNNKVLDIYLNGLPEVVCSIIKSTMAFDDSTHFRYTLLDIQQRAAVFIATAQEKYIFYCKSAHLATSLEVDKVNSSNCEFHLLGNHSTTSCPDYAIVRFPHMDFMPSIFCATLNGSSSSYLTTNRQIEGSTNIDVDSNTMTTPTISAVKQEEVEITKDARKVTKVILTDPEDTLIVDKAQAPVKSQFTKTLQKQPTATENTFAVKQSAASNQTTHSRPANQSANPTSSQSNTQPLVTAKPQPLTANKSEPPEGRKEVSVQRVHITPSGLTAVRSVHQYELTNEDKPDDAVSFIPTEKRLKRRADDILETGCIVHGKNSSHNTEECWDAQMVISRGRNHNGPPPAPAERKNLCAFCKQPFYKGHLNKCEKVPYSTHHNFKKRTKNNYPFDMK